MQGVLFGAEVLSGQLRIWLAPDTHTKGNLFICPASQKKTQLGWSKGLPMFLTIEL